MATETKPDTSSKDSALLRAIGVDSPMPTTTEGLLGLRDVVSGREIEAEEGIRKAKERASLVEQAGKAKIYKEEAEAKKPLEEQLMAQGKERPYPAPNKENIKEFASMFSVLSALTFAVGGKGRGAGMAGLAALNGAMEGYNKGRKDLFDMNMKEFDKKLAEYKTSLEATRDALRIVSDRAGLRTKEGLAALADAKLNDQGIIAAELEKGKIGKVLKDIDKRLAIVNQQQMQSDRMKHQEEMARLRRDLKEDSGGQPSKDERDRIVMRESILSRIPKLMDLVEQQQQSLGLKTLLNEQVISRLDVEGVPIRSALAQMDADYRFSKGGKALTKNENEILAGVTDWRGKKADAIMAQLESLYDYVQTDQNIYRQLYPGYMGRLESAAQPTTPSAAPKTTTGAPQQSQFVAGKIYTDAKGNKAKFKGGNPNDINNWETQ